MRLGRVAAAVLLAGAVATGCGAQDRAKPRAEQLDAGTLEALIDSLLPGISAASGLEVRRPVRYAMQAREDASRFIAQQLEEDLGPGELEGMARSYKALGLLPDTLDLHRLLLDLYTEQVVGYYDPRTDRLYVVEGVPTASAAPVVAHELVHALQDQLVPLDSLVGRERGSDRQMAAQAAAEGQATLVMLALQAEQTTGRRLDPAQLPDLATLLRPAVEAQNAQFPVFARAPRLIRETMLFPYVAGAAFLQALYGAAEGPGPVVPFGERLPQSTEQVMSPRERFIGGADAPTEIRLADAPMGWRTAYSNTLGQLELSIFLAEHLGTDAASAAEGWDGDRIVLLAAEDGAEAVIWYSVWDDADAADRFAAAYRRTLEQRPERAGRAERDRVEGREVVRIIDTAEDVDAADVPVPAIRFLGERPGL